MATVSIGLPVYNGSPYLEGALETICDQDFADFELVIADDCSTDGSFELCQAFAARDARIRLHRNATRLGVFANHNRVFELSSSPYFHWAGADDIHRPGFLGACLEALSGSSGHVLAHSAIGVIDRRGVYLRPYDNLLAGADHADPARRLRCVILEDPRCHMMYGLIRSDALRRTGLHRAYHNSDRTMMAQLALLGRFRHVPAQLYLNRTHPERYSETPEAWRRAGNGGGSRFPSYYSYLDYMRAVRRLVPDPGARRRCYRALAACLLHPTSLTTMALDTVAGTHWPSYVRLQRLKRVLKSRSAALPDGSSRTS